MPMTAEYLRALQRAIHADPDCAALAITAAAPKVAASTAAAQDAQIAAILRGKGWGAGSAAISATELKKYLIGSGRWRSIVMASQNDQHPAIDAAFAAVELANDARMTADMLDPRSKAPLDALVAAGLLSQQDRAALEDLCRTASAVRAEEVSRALRGPWGDET